MNNLFDKSIYLEEETHTYILKGKENVDFKSVTECISEYFEKFDKDKIAYKLVTTSPKYRGRKKEDLIAEWDATAKFGTKVHKEIEDYINTKESPKTERAIEGVKWLNKYLLKSDYDIYPETIIYCEKYKIAGTVDLLIYDKKNKIYSLLDWKTSKKINTSSFNQKTGIKSETYDLLDTKYNHYSLQLSLYRYLLEKNYNIKIQDQLIVHLDTDSVHGYMAPYLMSHIISILKHF